ncbi:unnamed protein product, partial [Discosporangium mesarthrocarpum]
MRSSHTEEGAGTGATGEPGALSGSGAGEGAAGDGKRVMTRSGSSSSLPPPSQGFRDHPGNGYATGFRMPPHSSLPEPGMRAPRAGTQSRGG